MAGESAGAFKSIAAFGRKTGAAPTAHRLNALLSVRSAAFEAQLERYPANLMKAAVELAKEWRTDRVLRRLEAMLAVADKQHSLIITAVPI